MQLKKFKGQVRTDTQAASFEEFVEDRKQVSLLQGNVVGKLEWGEKEGFESMVHEVSKLKGDIDYQKKRTHKIISKFNFTSCKPQRITNLSKQEEAVKCKEGWEHTDRVFKLISSGSKDKL